MKKVGLWAVLLCSVLLGCPAWAQDQGGLQIQEQSAHIKSEHRVPNISPASGSEQTSQEQPQVQAMDFQKLQPFGSELFTGRFKDTYYDELNPEYMIMPGDRIGVRIWGAMQFDEVLVVDSLGNIFIPDIGPVQVADKPYSQLESTVKSSISKVYSPEDFEAYVTLLNTQPTAVYVTGEVEQPGRYAGGFSESVLYYLDQAQGIDPEQGSYRSIKILRDGKVLDTVDLYPFLLCGQLPTPRLQEGDIILVSRKGTSIAVSGETRNKAWFEFEQAKVPGKKLLALAEPKPGVSHAYVQGTREGEPFYKFLPVQDFAQFQLRDQDQVSLVADVPAKVVPVEVQGPLQGESRFLVQKGTRLKELLRYIEVDPELANLQAIYLQRQSVAQRQKKALEQSLQRLEQTALTATSATAEESEIRVQEAELIQEFVQRSREELDPQGVVVVSPGQEVKNVLLEKDDVVTIPGHDDLILVTGEVRMPQAVVHEPQKSLQDYIDAAGGFSRRADQESLLLVRANGQVVPLDEDSRVSIQQGDHIMVLPYFETKNLQLAKDVSQILYHLAITTRTVVSPW